MDTGFFLPIQQTLLDIDELHSFSDLSTFAQHIPVEWIASALHLSTQATIRRRRFPSEQVLRLADDFLARIPDHSITQLDKGFWGADFLLRQASEGAQRHWLIHECKAVVSDELEWYGTHDRLLRMNVSPRAGKRNPALPETWTVRAVSYEVK